MWIIRKYAISSDHTVLWSNRKYDAKYKFTFTRIPLNVINFV